MYSLSVEVFCIIFMSIKERGSSRVEDLGLDFRVA